MAEIAIQVTKKHIEEGIRLCEGSDRVGFCCPIALAVAERFSSVLCEDEPVVVGHPDTILETADGRFVNIKLPAQAQKFVSDFDCADTVEPFEFGLPVPDWFEELTKKEAQP